VTESENAFASIPFNSAAQEPAGGAKILYLESFGEVDALALALSEATTTTTSASPVVAPSTATTSNPMPKTRRGKRDAMYVYCCKCTLITQEYRSKCADQCNNSNVSSGFITQKSLQYVLKRLLLVGGKTNGTSSGNITIGMKESYHHGMEQGYKKRKKLDGTGPYARVCRSSLRGR
jgi:hypothetical protein